MTESVGTPISSEITVTGIPITAKSYYGIFSAIKLVQLIEHFHSVALKLKSICCN